MELADTFRAGAAQVEITPPLGTIINGDFRAHYAHTIHDPLFSKAIVMATVTTTIAMVVVDICVMPKFYVDDIRHTIAAQLGIPFEHVLISSTHTHAAGSVAEAYLSNIDLGYSRKLPGLILESVKLAKDNLVKAKIAFGKIDVPAHVRSRRYFMDADYAPINPVNGKTDVVKTNPFGAAHHIRYAATVTDPGLGYFALQDHNGKWLAVLANYSLHYVGDWENGTISADYFGAFAASLSKELGADEGFVGILSNGTSGDINIWEFIKTFDYPTGNFEKSEYIGGDLAKKVSVSLQAADWQEKVDVGIVYQELQVDCRKPSGDEVAKANAIIANTDYATVAIDDEGLKKIYAREQVLLNEYPDFINFPIQVIKIGNAVIGALGGEIFASTGLWLKDHAGISDYFTISMANGNTGYVPPSEEFEKGGYETWRSRTSYLEENADTMIRGKVVEMIEKLKNKS